MSEHTTHHPTCDCVRERCHSCKAQIVWCHTNNRRFMPIDADPSKTRGNIRLQLQHNGTLYADVLPTAMAESKRSVGEQLHTSHFVTCPNANQHRKDRR